MFTPVWNDGIGFLKVSSRGWNYPNSLQIRNSKGKEVTVFITYDESVDVAQGHAIIYNNSKGEETVMVTFSK